MKFSRMRLIVSSLAVTLALAACAGGGGESGSSSSSSSSGETTASRDPGIPIRFGTVLEPKGLDPFSTTTTPSFQVISQMYDSLLGRDQAGVVDTSGLAESYTQPDDLTYVFTLRDGVTFHDGTPLTAADVVYSIDRYRGPESTSIFRAGYAAVKSVTATADNEVTIALSAASPGVLNYLSTTSSGAIVSQKWVETNGKDALQRGDAGTGPFAFSEWKSGQQIELTKYDGYWKSGVPTAGGLVFRYIAEEASLLSSLRQGDLDIAAFGSDGKTMELAKESGFETTAGPTVSNAFIMVNSLEGPLKDVRVRQALSVGLDRQALNDLVYGGTASLSGVIPAGDPYGLSAKDAAALPNYTHDPERAKELLKEAGLSSVTLEVILPSEANGAALVSTMEAAKEQLAPVGINLDMQLVPYSDLISKYYSGNFKDLLVSGGGVVPDPDQYMGIVFGAATPRHDSPELQELIAQARIESDPDKRRQLYDGIQEFVAEEALVVIPFAQPQGTYAWNKNVKGFEMDPLMMFRSLRTTG